MIPFLFFGVSELCNVIGNNAEFCVCMAPGGDFQTGFTFRGVCARA